MWCMSSSTHNKKDTEEYFRDMFKKKKDSYALSQRQRQETIISLSANDHNNM